jgi:DNA-binding NtrC family response regulator
VYRILVIDDDPVARGAADDALRSLGHHVVTADASAAMTLLADEDFQVVVTGLPPSRDVTPRLDPLAVPQELVCLPQPLSIDALVEAISEIEERAEVRRTLNEAERTLVETLGSGTIGTSSAMRLVLDRIAAVATSDAPVLLTGESGTGKELLARTIHAQSKRRDKPLVAVNCAAFPESLIESELFGHERGAFTGAHHKRDGTFKAADTGTLFLDEINGLSLAAQAKLLRVLEDGTFHPIGSDTPMAVDVRLMSATNRELKGLVASGAFREDLYYRIKVLDIAVPPLRERSGDLPLLIAYFLLKYAPPGRRPTLSPRAWAALSQHAFPGNVRELEHAIQHAIVLARGFQIEVEHLPRDISSLCGEPVLGSNAEISALSEAVREFEREYVLRALELAQGNKSHAARLLGMSRKHLWDKLRRFGVK